VGSPVLQEAARVPVMAVNSSPTATKSNGKVMRMRQL
jgi:hypothetical protein